MQHLPLNKLTIPEVLDGFIIKPEQIEIKNVRYPSRIECNETRKALRKNLAGIPSFDPRLEPMKWSITLIPEKKYIEYKIEKHNKAVVLKALDDAKAALAATDEEAAEALTVDTPSVKTAWENLIYTESSAEVQLPTFTNPGLFKPDASWNTKRIAQELETYHMDRDNYEGHMVIQHAGRKWLESIYGSHAWDELQSDDDEYQDMITLREIMEHLESKATKNEPVDIDGEIEKLTIPYNATEGMPAFFQRLKIIQTKLKDTEEPQTDTTLKRHAKREMLKVPHM